MKITKDEFKQITRQMIGLSVSHIWRGFGSALFLEFGKLSKEILRGKDGGKVIHLTGEYSIFAGWSWRIERLRSIYCGSWSTNRIIDNRFPVLKGKKLIGVDIEGRLPELVLTFSDNLWIYSFETSEGDSPWFIHHYKNKLTYDLITRRQGKLIIDLLKRDKRINRRLTRRSRPIRRRAGKLTE